MRAKRILVFISAFIMLFASGCWDRIEIEQRAIIVSITVDLTDAAQDTGQRNSKSPFCDEQPKILKVIFGMINPSKLQSGEYAYLLRTVEGSNIPDAIERLGEETSRNPFFGQTRFLILSEKLVKNEKVFREVLDEFERRTQINETMQVAVIKGDIEKLAKVEPMLENTLAAYIVGILHNSRILSNTVSMSLYELLAMLRNNDGNGVIPVLEIKGSQSQDISANELALIKDYKFLEYLDTKYVKTYKILNNNFQSGRKLIEYKGTLMSYYIYSADKRIWLEEDGDRLKYKVRIELEGDIEEYEFNKNLFDSETLKDISEIINKTVKLELEETTNYFQQQIGHDYLKFGDYTRKYHNSVYKRYKDNWDEAFKNAEIEYQVTAYIRRIGTSKK